MWFTDCPYINYTLPLRCGYNSQATYSSFGVFNRHCHYCHICCTYTFQYRMTLYQFDYCLLELYGQFTTTGRVIFKNSTFSGMAWTTSGQHTPDNVNSLQDIIGQGYTTKQMSISVDYSEFEDAQEKFKTQCNFHSIEVHNSQ